MMLQNRSMARPPPEYEKTQTSIVIYEHWLEEIDSVIIRALSAERPGAEVSRSEAIRAIMAAGFPILRKKYGLPTPPLPTPAAKPTAIKKIKKRAGYKRWEP